MTSYNSVEIVNSTRFMMSYSSVELGNSTSLMTSYNSVEIVSTSLMTSYSCVEIVNSTSLMVSCNSIERVNSTSLQNLAVTAQCLICCLCSCMLILHHLFYTLPVECADIIIWLMLKRDTRGLHSIGVNKVICNSTVQAGIELCAYPFKFLAYFCEANVKP